MAIEFSTLGTLLLAIAVLFMGKRVNQCVPPLRNFGIPESITGGLFVSILVGLLYTHGIELHFNIELRSFLLLVFFTNIGLSATFPALMKVGRPLAIFLALVIVALLIQNAVGTTIACLLGMHPAVGLVGGSISLCGGHGTAIAWAKQLQEAFGMDNAMEVGCMFATFGLVLSGLSGGPIARRLIRKQNLTTRKAQCSNESNYHAARYGVIDVDQMLSAMFVVAFAMLLGNKGAEMLVERGFFVPEFVICLFSGILVTNLLPFVWPRFHGISKSDSLQLISDTALGLFFVISLMSIKLWLLTEMAGSLLIILTVQVAIMLMYGYFVVYRVMGKDFDAAVLSSGFVGISLGATPNAMTNMTAVTQNYGASPKSFAIVPLVGAFFIDIVNSIVIRLFMTFIA